jgi:4-amino-4-deoxy-L-arabinose transferase-like glycosyltransferase
VSSALGISEPGRDPQSRPANEKSKFDAAGANNDERWAGKYLSKKGDRLWLLVLMTVFLLLAVLSSSGITVTLDEPLHYHYGLFVLDGRTDRIDDSSMPVSALNALPAHVGERLAPGWLKTVLGNFFVARLVTIIFGMLVAAVVFRWSRAMYGVVPAVFATTLYILDPNIIAHSQLVTTDVFAAGMVALSLWLAWRFARSGALKDELWCSILVGLSQLVKYSAISLFPLVMLAVFIHDLPSVRDAMQMRTRGWLVRVLGRQVGLFALMLASTVLILNVGFLFNHSFTRLSDYRFRSDIFLALQSRLATLGSLPVPVPYPYLQGLDWMRLTERTADRFGNVYLLGQLRKPDGFPGYYLVASALKVPIASQVIFLSALVVFVLGRDRRRSFTQDEVFLLLPVAFYALYFNFFFNAQTGLRYFLVAHPLMYVFGGGLFKHWPKWFAQWRLGALGLLVYLAISVLCYFPYFTPYFNELVWDKTQTYRYLSDTNLDWGQSRGELSRYLQEHPDAISNPPDMQPGRLVVSGSDLVGILEDPSKYAWLRENFSPVDTIARCYFVYVISPQQIRDLCARTGACP